MAAIVNCPKCGAKFELFAKMPEEENPDLPPEGEDEGAEGDEGEGEEGTPEDAMESVNKALQAVIDGKNPDEVAKEIRG